MIEIQEKESKRKRRRWKEVRMKPKPAGGKHKVEKSHKALDDESSICEGSYERDGGHLKR